MDNGSIGDYIRNFGGTTKYSSVDLLKVFMNIHKTFSSKLEILERSARRTVRIAII
jgi:hypothetical protein